MSEEVKELLEKIVNKLDELDKRISALENGKTPKKIERRNVIETSKFLTEFTPAKKGVAIVTKYAKFIEIRDHTAYAVLTPEEFEEYLEKFYREGKRLLNELKNGSSNFSKSASRSASRTTVRKKKSRVRVVEE